MFSNNNNNILSKFLKINLNEDISLDNDSSDIENRFNKNFIVKESEKYDELELLNNDDANTIFSSMFSLSTFTPFNESEDGKILDNLLILNNPINSDNNHLSSKNLESNDKKRIFEVIYKKPEGLFTLIENDNLNKKGKEFLFKRKRLPFRRQRKDNQDNIRKKIKRGFFNKSLIYKLNEKLKKIGSNKYFEKFPPHFVSDIDQKRNKDIFGKTLAELFENKDIYNYEKKNGLNNYLHNIKVAKNEDIINNIEFRNIMKKTVGELYEEYINSYEFKTLEINRIKNSKMKDDYVNRYIYLANHLSEFFSQ